MEKLFEPKSIVLIGASATPGKLGFDILENLVESDYKGKIYPLNPKGGEILGKKVYKKIVDLPKNIDLAVVAVPAQFVGQVVEECGQKNIKNIVIISAGFKEVGGEGAEREEELKKLIEKYDLNLIGPNCLGILNTHIDLNASFAEGMPKKGKIALLSQSGAMAVAIADWAYGENIGFSKIVSMGNKAGVDENKLLEYLENDKETEVIMMYLESFVDGEEFMKQAQKLAQKKPIIVLKSGVSDAGSSAVASHTGALAGSDKATETALRQSGIIRANCIESFFDYARVFSMQKLPKGNKVAIITNAGGPGVITTDTIEQSDFLEIAELAEKTKKQLKKDLPTTANTHNPVDVIGDALADRYEKALSSVLTDDGVDMVITILTPQIMTEKEKTARILANFNDLYPDKPLFASFIGGKNIEYASEKLAEYGVPNFVYPSRAIGAMEAMVKLKNWREQKKVCTIKIQNKAPVDLREKVKKAIKTGDRALPQKLVSEIFIHYGISVPQIKLAKNAKQAVEEADKIGYPVVMKICSDDVLHKTDAGGVRLSVKNAQEVKEAYEQIMKNVLGKFPKAHIKGILVQKMYHVGREVIVGMKRDPVFGPLIMFGLGGIYVEVMKDVSFRVAPFSECDALEMIEEIRAVKLLKGVRGQAPADIKKLSEAVLAVSRFALDFPEIKEMDINPLMVFDEGEGAVALDSRVLV